MEAGAGEGHQVEEEVEEEAEEVEEEEVEEEEVEEMYTEHTTITWYIHDTYNIDSG